MTEYRDVDATTGGEKNVKIVRHDLVPVEILHEDAILYAVGAAKYSDDNWRKGYKFSSSYAAMRRHMDLWWAGQDIDIETGTHHLINARWHAATLRANSRAIDDGELPGLLDDRPRSVDLEQITDDCVHSRVITNV